MPQKKFFGKGISEEAATCRAGALVKAADDDTGPAALDETLHAEKRPAGSAAMAAALEVDCRNCRRDRRNMDFTRDSMTFYKIRLNRQNSVNYSNGAVGKRSVSGHRFSDAVKGDNPNGF